MLGLLLFAAFCLVSACTHCTVVSCRAARGRHMWRWGLGRVPAASRWRRWSRRLQRWGPGRVVSRRRWQRVLQRIWCTRHCLTSDSPCLRTCFLYIDILVDRALTRNVTPCMQSCSINEFLAASAFYVGIPGALEDALILLDVCWTQRLWSCWMQTSRMRWRTVTAYG